MEKRKLNLGSGNDYRRGWVNLDYNKKYRTDVLHDLGKFPYPFKSEEFDYIYCSHILEHADDLFRTLRELLRIVKKDGIIHIRVPHFSNGYGYGDLSHKRFFGWQTFRLIREGYFNERVDFKIAEQRFNFLSTDYPAANKMFSWIWNAMPKHFYERFLCWILPVGEIEIKIKKI